MKNTAEYDTAIVAELRERRRETATRLTKIDAAIEIFLDLRRGPENAVQEVPTTDSFAGLTLPQAIVAFLEREGTPQAPRTIAKSLIHGGFETKSKNLTKMVSNTLTRMKSKGEVTNRNGKWTAQRKMK